MSLWDWVAQVYRDPDVERLCLTLQDVHGQCVSYLLWASWTAAVGRPVTSADFDRAAAMARAWDDRALKPLRAARRGLKPAAPGVPDQDREALRARVQGDELAAERLLLEALERLTPEAKGGPLDAATTLFQAALAWNGDAPETLQALADAFSQG